MCWERCRKTQVARGWVAGAGHCLGEPGGGCSQRGRMESGGRVQTGGEERPKSMEGAHLTVHRSASPTRALGNGPAA